MRKTVLILGASGRFGRNAACSFNWAGWDVRHYSRSQDSLPDAAWGADLIVNAWNPPYPQWAEQVPGYTAQIIQTAKETGAAVLIPGNVYNFGADMPDILDENTPQLATNPLGRIRIEMEEAYREAGVKTIILRAGDFIDTQSSGNWFDRIMLAKAKTGIFTYPGDPNIPHAWSFLPDVTDAAALIAERLDQLDSFTDISAPSFNLTGHQLVDAVSDALGTSLTLKEMSWLPIQIARPFWPMAKPLLEMRYLWNTPHSLISDRLHQIIPEFEATPLRHALQASLPENIHPDGFVGRSVATLPRRQAFAFNCCSGNAKPG